MHRAIVRTMGALLATTMALVCRADTEKPLVLGMPVADLQVVRTWDELMKVPSVMLGTSEVKLGTEATECAEGSGVLVYCVPQKNFQMDARRGDDEVGHNLGPLTMKVVSKAPKQRLGRVLHKILFEAGDTMFIASARGRGAEPFEIQVFTPDGTLLAKRKISVVRKTDPGWREFHEPQEKAADTTVLSPVGKTVVPRWDGSTPWNKTETLPQFLPQTEDKSLEVSMKDGVVRIKSTKPIKQDLYDHWAIRWWINGELAQPVLPEEKLKHLMQKSRERELPIELSFKVKLEPDVLPTRAGDRVEFQLLYCSEGFAPLEGNEAVMEHLRQLRIDNREETGVRMTKRIAWNP